MPGIFHAGIQANLTKRGPYYQAKWYVDGKRHRRSTGKTELEGARDRAVALIERSLKRSKTVQDSAADWHAAEELSVKKLSWDGVYRHWCLGIERLGLRPGDLFPSKKLVLEKVPSTLCPLMVDWRKKASFDDDLAVLEGRSNFIGGWGTTPGVLHTAYLLQHVAESTEEKAAVFIRAFIHQTRAQLPSDWRGDRASSLLKLFRLTEEAHPNLGDWHHSVRHTLPVSIPSAFEQRPFGFWEYESDLTFLMAIEASLLSSAWNLLDLEFKNESRCG